MGDFIGVRCNDVGLTASNIIPRLSHVTLTKGMILELRLVMNSVLLKSIAVKLECKPTSLWSAMVRVNKKHMRLNKSAKQAFRESVFKPPKTIITSEEKIRDLERKLADSEKKRVEQKRQADRKLQDLCSTIEEVGKPKDWIKNVKRLCNSRLRWRKKFWFLNSSYTHLKSIHRRALNRCKMLKSKIDPQNSRNPVQSPNNDYINGLHCYINDLEEQVGKLTEATKTRQGKESSS
ncbi:uncharacterized protein LOC115921655 [Strongylocentrotus purpuratus]|uniref:Uncharacterized protein n=1 Tax=Strongylocentrotus purpuratus TaxID=7668 RepID=A0A7M7NER3_STRPU|nr:uncharacterized protein LOC115921655 [Strongylocentrotus purpuratus]